MKNILKFFIVGTLFLSVLTVNAQTSKNVANKQVTPKVEVYYFHFTARCATCHAVEDNSKQALETLYPQQVKMGEYVFKAMNLNDAATKPIAEKLGVSGQTLLVVSGSKKIDLTRQGFLYAFEPDKLKEEIGKAVANVLR
ncbi:MAG: nitrophenyl compound nitroreductase subunit ArsF family protein [Bacteroidales bacterium]